MDMNSWINRKLPEVVNRLEQGINSGYEVNTADGLDLTGRKAIFDILEDILSALFPTCFSHDKIARSEMNFYLGDTLRHIAFKLGKQIRDVFRLRCIRTSCENCSCEERAHEALIHLIESLPEIRETLLEDVRAAYEGDPAAQSVDEIVLSYPCIEAIATHRIAHELYEFDVPIIPRIMAERAHSRTGIDIHPGARIGPHFFIDHGTGVVIGETCTIGRNVKIYQGVTLGALSFPLNKEGKPIKGIKRHPDIEDDVIIYANATILGGETCIGKGAVIGGNTWITSSVSAGAQVYEMPSRGHSRTRILQGQMSDKPEK